MRAGYNRNFLFLLIGQFVSVIGDRISTIIFLSIIINLVGTVESSYQSTLIVAVQIVPFFLFGYLFGLLADKVPKKQIMIKSDMLRGLLILGMFLFYEQLTILSVYICVFIIGTLSSMFEPSRKAIIPFIVPKEKITMMNKVYATFEIGAMLIGFLVGAFLLEIIDPRDALLIDLGTYLFSMILLMFIKYNDNLQNISIEEETKGIREGLKKYGHELKQGMLYIRKNDNVKYVITNIIVFHFFAVSMFFATVNDYGIRTAHILGIAPASNVSLLLLVVAIGALCSPMYKFFFKNTRDSTLTQIIFFAGGILVIMQGLLVNFVPNFYYLNFILFFLLGIIAGAQYIRFLYIIHLNTEKEVMGRVISIAEITWSLVIVLGIGVGSLLNELYTYEVAFYICGLVYIVAALSFNFITDKIDW